MLKIINRFILLTICAITAYAANIPSDAEATVLHAILIGDTLDANVGVSVRKDLMNMQNMIRTIAANTNLQIKEQIISGLDAKEENVFIALESLQVSPDDVVIFYFSGHGYHDRAQRDPWPIMYFTLQRRGMELDLAVDLIHNKNPRLILAISDSCNNFIDTYRPPQNAKVITKAANVNNYQRENLQHLFLETSGVIIASGAQVGETSSCTIFGGFFTNAFVENLSKLTRSIKNANWGDIMNEAAASITQHQIPLYNIYAASDQK